MVWLTLLFSIIGFIVVMGIIYFLYSTYVFPKGRTESRDKYPGGRANFIRTGQCPDYWVEKGVNKDGRIICENEFNLEVADPAVCYDDQNRKYFERINSLDASDKAIMERCLFINKCGVNKKTPASWLGVEEHC